MADRLVQPRPSGLSPVILPNGVALKHALVVGLARLAIVALLAASAGCTSINFYAQAIAGQWQLWSKQTPIEALLQQNSLDQTTRDKLMRVLEARTFAHTTLKLPNNDSYRDYVDLGREYVVWNVFAAPELSLEPHQSCFLFAGCLSYRGYFKRLDAERFAAQLKAAGNDTFVAGVAAYSTLGWFDDPVLSSMLRWSEQQLIAILFHELAHQQLYVKGDTSFNESFAVAVAESGLQAWFELKGTPDSGRAARQARQREQQLTALLLETQQTLKTVFSGSATPADKRQQKKRIYAALEVEYERLKASWDGDQRFDAWMAQGWNNARLSSVATYHQWVPAFAALLQMLNHDYARAYQVTAEIGELDRQAREQCLRALADNSPAQGCPRSISAVISQTKK